MRRDQLEHATSTACQIIGHDAVVIVGPQSILGSFTEKELPTEATMSSEIDILPLGDDRGEIARLADLIEGVAGASRSSMAHPERSSRKSRRASRLTSAYTSAATRNGWLCCPAAAIR